MDYWMNGKKEIGYYFSIYPTIQQSIYTLLIIWKKL